MNSYLLLTKQKKIFEALPLIFSLSCYVWIQEWRVGYNVNISAEEGPFHWWAVNTSSVENTCESTESFMAVFEKSHEKRTVSLINQTIN